MSNVVWIVGAGLSQSLGGPLLDDLLSVARGERVTACFPKDKYKRLHENLPVRFASSTSSTAHVRLTTEVEDGPTRSRCLEFLE